MHDPNDAMSDLLQYRAGAGDIRANRVGDRHLPPPALWGSHEASSSNEGDIFDAFAQ
jgi:hypothetical protein